SICSTPGVILNNIDEDHSAIWIIGPGRLYIDHSVFITVDRKIVVVFTNVPVSRRKPDLEDLVIPEVRNLTLHQSFLGRVACGVFPLLRNIEANRFRYSCSQIVERGVNLVA